MHVPESRGKTARRGIAAWAAVLLAAAAAGCGEPAVDREGGRRPSTEPRPGPEEGNRAVVVVSVPPLAWFVERLAGDRAEVSVMVPPGASPATYEPTTRQMRVVAEADLYVAVGHPRFPFEAAWLDALAGSNPRMAVVRAGRACRPLPADPHLWLSTACARDMVDVVAGALGDALEVTPRDLEERGRALGATVDSVASEVSRRLEPHRGRAFLVFHPALGYLARDFGLRQMAIARGPAGPGAAELGAIVRDAREAGIHTVFVQPQFSQEAARVVARELPGGRVRTVDPLARDWASAMVEIARRLSDSFRPLELSGRAARAPGPDVPSAP